MADILDLDVQHDEAMAIDDADGDITITKLKSKATTKKGRGFTSGKERERFKNFDTIPAAKDDFPASEAQRSVEGYILICTGLHEESHEDDIQSKFVEFGEVKNLHLNLDRRTGFLKGYGLIEYETFKEAQAAKMALNGTELLGATITVDWAFVKKPKPYSRRKH